MNAAPDYREQIAALEREVKEAERRGAIKALREAADEMFEGRTFTLEHFVVVNQFAVALRSRADRIEAESPHGLRCIQTPCDACRAGGGS